MSMIDYDAVVCDLNSNDLIFALVKLHGLKAVVTGLSVACARQQELVGNDIGSESRVKAWEADETTITTILPLIVNEIIDWTKLYENGECPDCAETIPTDAVDGDRCKNCGHVFTAETA